MLLASVCMGLSLALFTDAAEPRTRSYGLDPVGHFTFEAETPAGTRHAVLEISTDLSPAGWRPMIAQAVDGRAARVLFRLPPQTGPRLFTRVKTSDSPTLPPVELSGEDLSFVSYDDRIEESTRLDFLANASDKIREFKALPVAQWQANLIAWALQDPNVAEAKPSTITNDVMVRFKDGVDATFLRPPRRYTGPAGMTAPLSAKTRRAARAPMMEAIGPKMETQPGENLPGSDNAITAFSLESTFPNSAPTIGSWLSANRYKVTHFPSTTVEQISSWSANKPIGVLFWQSHGAPYSLGNGKEGFGLVTRQFAPEFLREGKFEGMVKAGELKFAIDDNPWKIPYFTIPAKFVRNHMKFAPNSIVVVDACFGASAELAKGFIDAGCGSYASYDWLSGPWSGTPCLKVFDRLLGMNQEPPVSSPIERPFSLKTIRWWMSAMDYDVDPSPQYEDQERPNARLTWYHHATNPGHILKPTIMRVLHENAYPGELYSKYLIEGDFGRDPGEANREILWGGQRMHVVRWEPQMGITIRIPEVPPKGNIEVVMKEHFTTRSNPVPITEWTVPFHVVQKSQGSLMAKMDMNVKFRGDIRGSRGNPEMPVQYLGTIFSNMADCTGTLSASGTHNPSSNTAITWSDGSELTSVDTNADQTYAPRRIRCSGTIYFNNSYINPLLLAADGDFTETEVRSSNGSTTTTVRRQTLGFVGFYPQPQMPLEWGSGAFTGNTINYPGTGLTISWDTATPQFLPDNNTPR
jgi:hypothetical protein